MWHVPCADCAKRIQRGGQSARPGEARCRPCFLAHKARNRAHNASGYQKGCRCDVCREAVNAQNRAQYAKRNRYVEPDRTCMICGVAFSGRNHGAKTCSDECARQRQIVKAWTYQARKRGAFVAAVVPTEIFERDGWRCHICRRKIRAATQWPHPRSASLDHLVPLSRGGTHEPANVATACLGCNSAKGNRGGNEQLLLVG